MEKIMDKVVIGISRGDSLRGKIKVDKEDISERLEGRWGVIKSKQGEELVKITCVTKCKDSCKEKKELGKLERVLGKEDIVSIREIRDFEEKAHKICLGLIQKHALPMRIIKTNLSFDRQRLKFYFVAEERVDFRSLVRDLVTRFHKMIRLQQISPRDHARILNGAGICGRELCCATFYEESGIIKKVNLRTKIDKQGSDMTTGACGKLMCCLKFEGERND